MSMPQYKYDFNTVTYAANGQWASIISALSQVSYDWDKVIKKIDRNSKSGNPCPVHGGKDGFRLFQDFYETGGAFSQRDGAFSNGFQLLAWINNQQIGKVLCEVAEFLQLDPADKISRQNVPKRQIKAKAKKTELVDLNAVKRIQKVWSESVLITKGDPVDKYLIARGIELSSIPACMRYHDNLPYFEEIEGKAMAETGRYPALILNVTNDENKTVCLHRIYLTKDGLKADVSDPKKMMMAYKPNGTTGAAIKFFDAKNGDLALAEGPETALAVHVATGLPVWSCANAHLLSRVIIPAEVKRVFIYADKDLSGTGQNAAIELHERLLRAGIMAIICLPTATVPRDAKSIDWLDVLNKQGKKGFQA